MMNFQIKLRQQIGFCEPVVFNRWLSMFIYYLYVRFHYGIDFREYFHLWQVDAAEQRMMEMIKLTFPNRLIGPEG
jgi:hypothetical protein